LIANLTTRGLGFWPASLRTTRPAPGLFQTGTGEQRVLMNADARNMAALVRI
jgi:hypothetical protein